MKHSKIITHSILVILAVAFCASPLSAQQKHPVTRKPAPAAPAQPPEPVPTFDTLLADDSYRIYFETRNLGQFLRSPAMTELPEQMRKIVGTSKEVTSILQWLNAHAESLAGSRLLVAGWPNQTKLPAVLMAIEFSTPEAAQKFEPELRRLVSMLAPQPEPPPAPATGPATTTNTAPPRPNAGSSVPYYLTHAGTLVLLSEKPFAFHDLKPRHAKLLVEDPNFVTARNRFASESLFLYVDTKAIEKEELDRRKQMEEAEQKRIEEAAKHPTPEPSTDITDNFTVTAIPKEVTIEEPPPPASGDATLESSEPTNPATPVVQTDDSQRENNSQLLNTLMYSLYGGLFGGPAKWPEAVAVAADLDSDAYVIRALILNSADNHAAIPFYPQFIAGPALSPGSPGVLPADAELFVAASLDYPQIYDGLLKTIAGMNERAAQYALPAAGTAPTVSPFAEYEKKLGLKIKDDILPLLGNELALAMLPKTNNVSAADTNAKPAPDSRQQAKPSDPDPIIAIAIKDKEAVRRVLPKLIEVLGGKGANLLAQTERKEDTEITTYANLLSYAFIGDFLILSPNPDATKSVVNSYLAGETLAANTQFHNANRWQARQVLGQVYVVPALVQNYWFPRGGPNFGNPKSLEMLSRLSSIEPLTYSLSNEGPGPLHELHFPKNLLLLLAASAANDLDSSRLAANEAAARSELRTLVSAEVTYQATTGDGHFGTIDELVTAGLISKETLDRNGYRLELSAAANKFEATAVPLEYGRTGSLSYFVDESGLLRGGDRGGGPATVSDPPIQ